MGGKGSGNFGRPKLKLGIYKIFGFTTIDNPKCYFYIGVSKNFLTKVKHCYIYQSKNRLWMNNILYNKIKELDYKFNIIEIEKLPKEFSFKDAKLHLQNNYLKDNMNNLVNTQEYCFCKQPPTKHMLPLKTRKEIASMYRCGIKPTYIAETLNVPKHTIEQVLARQGVNKKKLIEEAIIKYKDGMSLESIKLEYNFSEHIMNKIKENNI